MPARRIGLACPICDQVGITSHLYEVPPSLATLCESGNSAHRWNDSNKLREAHPRKLELPPPHHSIQRDYTSLTLQAPRDLESMLRVKYGDTYESSVVSLLRSFAEENLLILNMADLERIALRLGTMPTTGAELFGLIFQIGEETNSLRMEVKRLERASIAQNNNSAVILDLGDFLSKATAKAAEANMNTEEYLGAFLRTALENDWTSV